MHAKIKIGVTVYLTEDGVIGLTTTSQNPLTVLGLLMKGVQIAQGNVNVQREEPSNIVVPSMS